MLTKIDEGLRRRGWVVASLIFDGVLVEHRKESSLRAAVDAVEGDLRREGWGHVKLAIKPLYGEQEAGKEGAWPIVTVRQANKVLDRV